ncbi:MAG: peroxiredoxin [Halochromatium sp.]|uniref:peroxiredoxin n=1 Tax=Halochromatium sp. TaxID=2049430 RepID=UPI00397C734B
MLQAGDQAPEFSLPDADMERVKSTDLLREHSLVLCFYPKDDTPRCTMEALEFTDLQPEFEACGATIVGISRDTCASHGAFRDKYGLTMRLLADTDGEVCQAYGVLREKEKNGQRLLGIARTTFIIGRDGIIQHVVYDVVPKGHARRILEWVQHTLAPSSATGD